MIYAIFACDDSWGIGKNGTLPWPHNSADLKWFKSLTEHSTIIMGRKTWDSLPVKPLPKRKNIVVSSSSVEGAHISVSINQLKKITIPMLEYVGDIWIIGGAQLLESCIDEIDEIWLSRIKSDYNCDTFLPKNLIEEKFELYEHYFDGKLITEKYKRISNEAIS
jgi:dihydrofolate reductase